MAKKVLLINKGLSYLPEIKAYIKYFNNKTEFYLYDSIELNDFSMNDFDVLWYFMGTDFSKVDRLKVHDYASLSIGTFPILKNKFKRYFNSIPDLRIFLNESVRDGFAFRDNVDYVLRDMGIDKDFFIKNKDKEYDYVYVGVISKERQIPMLLNRFRSTLLSERIILIGSVPDDIYNEYKNCNNIIFTGKVKYSEVPLIASKAEYGINLIPDRYPFNIQTSTKILEYIAMNLKVVTTDYYWIRQFERKYKIRFAKLNNDLSNLSITYLEKLNYEQLDIRHLEWGNLLDKSRIAEKLTMLIN